MDPNARNLLEAIELDVPPPRYKLGPESDRKVKNPERFETNLKAIVQRNAKRHGVIRLLIVAWIAMLIITAVAADNPYASLLAVGAGGGGTVWAVGVLRRLSQEQLFAELLLLARRNDTWRTFLVDKYRELVLGASANNAHEEKETPETVADPSAAS